MQSVQYGVPMQRMVDGFMNCNNVFFVRKSKILYLLNNEILIWHGGLILFYQYGAPMHVYVFFVAFYSRVPYLSKIAFHSNLPSFAINRYTDHTPVVGSSPQSTKKIIQIPLTRQTSLMLQTLTTANTTNCKLHSLSSRNKHTQPNKSFKYFL